MIHCFAGCDTEAILDAVGLTFQDVMPERIEPQPSRQLRFSAHDAVKMAQHEVSVCCIILADLLAKRTPTEKDWNRLALAHSRLSAFIDEAERR